MIITIVSFKGGVGKTTTAIHLAAYLQKSGKTVLLDGDLNRSATAWAARGNDSLPFTVVDEQLGFTANDARHAVIDTAARPAPAVLKALATKVDLIIIPTTTDGLSLDALAKTVEALREVDADKFRVLLTMVPPRPARDGDIARAAFEEAGLPLFKGSIRLLKSFKTAGTQGVLVSDVKDPRASLGWDDYAEVGAELKKFAKR
ncbi:ParA family protein [Paludisphaera borealis]|uniref:Nucleotide binding domain n=1 Tax=Paludisphaera borealis TaxID=1387353 RepID=A0A1U7CZB6_9BACT|nr:ParA family protein [Paludisphaera borealis]APW64300.1 nucleotide binding domain [Paludisphaera borealis]